MNSESKLRVDFGDETATIHLDREIDDALVNSAALALDELAGRYGYRRVELCLASPGGSVASMEYLLSSLAEWERRGVAVDTRALTGAQSAAAVILSCGGERRAHPKSRLLYHEARQLEPGTATEGSTRERRAALGEAWDGRWHILPQLPAAMDPEKDRDAGAGSGAAPYTTAATNGAATRAALRESACGKTGSRIATRPISHDRRHRSLQAASSKESDGCFMRVMDDMKRPSFNLLEARVTHALRSGFRIAGWLRIWGRQRKSHWRFQISVEAMAYPANGWVTVCLTSHCAGSDTAKVLSNKNMRVNNGDFASRGLLGDGSAI